MKTKKKTKKSTIEQLREIRDKIGEEIKNLSSDEILKYFSKKKRLIKKSR